MRLGRETSCDGHELPEGDSVTSQSVVWAQHNPAGAVTCFVSVPGPLFSVKERCG